MKNTVWALWGRSVGEVYSCHCFSWEKLLFELRPFLLQPLFDWLRGEGVSNGLLGEPPHGLLSQTKGGGSQLVLLREIRAEHALIIRLTGHEEQQDFCYFLIEFINTFLKKIHLHSFKSVWIENSAGEKNSRREHMGVLDYTSTGSDACHRKALFDLWH